MEATARMKIRVAPFGRSAGFVFRNRAGVQIPPQDQLSRARDGMHVAVTFWSCHGIFEVDAQSLN
jgi:hypothetical protein